MTAAITIAGYLCFVVAGFVIWLVTRREKSKVASLGELLDRVMHHRATRVAIMLAWWWIGWHFLVNQVGR
ncbi:MAG: hypothetical protein RLZZ380_700 [Actinomycetota bacterium]|jgi:ABC-type Fe3+ transport system permease subunit